jgi:hypothetical protein
MMIRSITEKTKEKVDRSQAGPQYRCARWLIIISRSRKGQLLVNITDDGQIIEANQLIREYFGPAPFLSNRENRDVINAMNAMVFSMAAAELRVSTDADPNLMEEWKSVVSANLRTLFS